MANDQRIGISNPVCAFHFALADLADSQDGTNIPVNSDNDEYVMPWNGHIVGISAALNAAMTAGVVTIKPAINGTEDADAQIQLKTGSFQYVSDSWDRVGETDFSAGNRLSVVYDSDGDVEANTVDVVVTVFVVFDEDF